MWRVSCCSRRMQGPQGCVPNSRTAAGCTANVSLRSRNYVKCSSSTLVISPLDASLSFIDLGYPSSAGGGTPCHDSLIVSCDEKTISAHVLPSTGTAAITSALWLTSTKILLGACSGEWSVLTLSDSWQCARRCVSIQYLGTDSASLASSPLRLRRFYVDMLRITCIFPEL